MKPNNWLLGHRSTNKRRTLHVESLETRTLLAADPVISEFLARNDGGLRDGTGRSSDWIEIYNAGDQPVDLSGYRLTDNPLEMSKWTFPSQRLGVGEYLIVFASGAGEDSNFVDPEGHLHTNFTLKRGGEYLALTDPEGVTLSQFGSRDADYPEQLTNVSFGMSSSAELITPSSESFYLVPTDASVDSHWTQREFDAAAHGFQQGTASLGLETRPTNRTNFVGQFETELPEGTLSVYARAEFNLNQASAVSKLSLDLKYDNGFVIYLNGQRILSENAPDQPAWSSQALDGSRDDTLALDSMFHDLTEHRGLLVDGKNVLALHGLNHSSDVSDLLLAAALNGQSNDLQVAFGVAAKQGYLPTPTPGAPNGSSSDVFSGFVQDTSFSVDRGFYSKPFQVEISTETEGAQIRYTTDSSQPTATSGIEYTGPIPMDKFTVLRAAAFKADMIPTNVDTQTYFFIQDVLTQTRPDGYPTLHQNADYDVDPDIALNPRYHERMLAGLRDIPSLSVAIDVEDFVGREGIYEKSDARGSGSERPVSAEMFAADGSSMFQSDAGLRIQGGASRSQGGKHAFSLRFRNQYGAGSLDYPLFPGSSVTQFDTISLRAGFNNSWIHAEASQRQRSLYIRDQWMRDSLLEMGNVDAGRGFSVHLYINGLYWGLYNLVERPDADHYERYFGGDPDQLDARNGGQYISGTSDAFDEMVSAAKDGDWATIQQVLDVDNFIDYQIINQYGANSDLKVDGNWRAVGGGPGRRPWRVYSWDAERVLESAGTLTTPLDPFNIRRDLEQIDEYKVRFADRLQKHLLNGGALTPEIAARRFQRRVNELDLAVIAESARWGDHRRADQPYERDNEWDREQRRLVDEFFPVRSDIVLQGYRSRGLFPAIDASVFNQHGGLVERGFEVELSTEVGTIYFTTDGSDPRLPGGQLSPTAGQYAGPISLRSDSRIRTRVLLDGEWSAINEAEFAITSELPLRITEVNYRPHEANLVPGLAEPDVGSPSFEFVEVTNIGAESVSLAGLRLMKSSVSGDTQGIDFQFAAQPLAAGQSIVVTNDVESFRSRYGAGVRIAAGNDGDNGTSGEFGGSLSDDGERLLLVDATGRVVHRVDYETTDQWPARADGLGSTLELVGESRDASRPQDWRPSSGFGGSPGTADTHTAFGIVVNELLPHVPGDEVDLFELHNSQASAVDISNWYISDSTENYFKSRIAGSTSIPAGGFHVLMESDVGLSLNSSTGGTVTLVQADSSGRPLRFVDEVSFGPTFTGVSIGRVTGKDGLVVLDVSTFGSTNALERFPDIIISEVHYNPLDPDGPRGIRPDNLEFVEIYNRSSETIELGDWRLAGGVSFEFPQGEMLGPGQAVPVVGFRITSASGLSDFRAQYSLPPDSRLLGGYAGSLKDTADQIKLLERDPASTDSMPVWVTVDEVSYDSTSPWPPGANGQGDSLQRTGPTAPGQLSVSWRAAAPSPNAANFTDRIVGDANGDGVFDQLDIVTILQAAKYLTGELASFAEGDFNDDGRFDSLDIVLALQEGRYNISTDV